MIKRRYFYFSILALGAIAASAFAQSGPSGSVRSETIRLVKEGKVTDAGSLLDANVARGQGKDARDQATAQEWLGVATYFFNMRDLVSAQSALAEGVKLAAAIKQKKGSAEDLYYFYRNVGMLTETISRDRAAALDYYELALQASATGAKVAPAEVAELKRKIAKSRADDAVAKSRLSR